MANMNSRMSATKTSLPKIKNVEVKTGENEEKLDPPKGS